MKRLTVGNWFELIISAIALLFFIIAFGYNPTARSIPQVLSLLLVFFLMVLFLTDVSPAVRKIFGPIVLEKGLFSESTEREKNKAANVDPHRTAGNAEGASNTTYKSQRKELISLAYQLIWIAAFAVMIRYVSYLICVPVWILFFVKFASHRSWLSAIALAAGTGIFNYVLFALVLQSNF